MLEDYVNRLRTFLLIATTSVMFILYGYLVFFAREPMMKFIHLPISGLFLLGIYAVWKLYKYYRLFDVFMFTYACTVQMWYTYSQGSFESQTIFWAFPFLAGIYILIGHKVAVFYFFYFVLGQWLLYFYDPGELLFKSIGTVTKGFIFSFCYFLVLYFAFLQQRVFSQYRRIKEENEKNKTLLQVKGGLLHQINNPLSVVESLLKSNQVSPDKLEMLRRNTKRINEVMSELNRIDSITDLELKEYTDKTQVFHFKYRG